LHKNKQLFAIKIFLISNLKIRCKIRATSNVMNCV